MRLIQCRAADAERVRSRLEEAGLLCKSQRPMKSEGTVAFPIVDSSMHDALLDGVEVRVLDGVEVRVLEGVEVRVLEGDWEAQLRPSKQQAKPPLVCVLEGLRARMSAETWSAMVQAIEGLGYCHYGPVLLFTGRDPLAGFAPEIATTVWEEVGRVFSSQERTVAMIACTCPIRRDDPVRSPRLQVLHLRDGVTADAVWAETRVDGLSFTWHPTHSMFSPGNVSEKLRLRRLVAREQAVNEVIVDLFAGIGYWSVPLATCPRTQTVYACDWNEWSIAALRKNAERNGVGHRIVVLPGDNAVSLTHYRNCADRVLLGLLPSSRAAWSLAVEAVRLPRCAEDGPAMLHVHENVLEGAEDAVVAEMEAAFVRLFCEGRGVSMRVVTTHRERVKSFAPRVHHWVFDVQVTCVRACECECECACECACEFECACEWECCNCTVHTHTHTRAHGNLQ